MTKPPRRGSADRRLASRTVTSRRWLPTRELLHHGVDLPAARARHVRDAIADRGGRVAPELPRPQLLGRPGSQVKSGVGTEPRHLSAKPVGRQPTGGRPQRCFCEPPAPRAERSARRVGLVNVSLVRATGEFSAPSRSHLRRARGAGRHHRQHWEPRAPSTRSVGRPAGVREPVKVG